MSRFLLLLLFLIWMAWHSEGEAPQRTRAADLALFFAVYGFVVVMIAMWSRLVARRIVRGGLRRGSRYFGRITFAAQLFIPLWLAVGTFFLGWGSFVQSLLGPVSVYPVQVPGAIIGTLPAVLTWMALWWAQYPADRALREQTMLVRFDDDLPITTSPSMGAYLKQNLRLQILFTAAPILLILSLHDIVMLILWRGFEINVEGSAAEGIVTLCSAIAVFIVSPVLLARILGAYPLPPSALRDRMEAMASLHRLRFQQILLWPTHQRIANALVMGVVPRFRYVLLSDLLLEEMTDEQIEAVFAHELGHVVHRHMIWYLVFMKVLILALAVVALVLEAVQKNWFKLPPWLPIDLLMTLVGFGAFIIAFGFVSRRFERQADVFAARTLEKLGEAHGWFVAQANPDDPSTSFAAQGLANLPATVPAAVATASAPVPQPVNYHTHSHVGPLGASVFASALERVALINNMPLGSPRRREGNLIQRLGGFVEQFADLANNWLHGSIATRMRALHRMSMDPAHTRRFDKRMARLYVTLLVALVLSGALAWAIKLPI